MATIHNEIDNWLVADLHGELLADERDALHTHLVDCAACRKTHQEIKIMNEILEETLAQEKPDPAFEQRILAGFRKRVPQRNGFLKFLSDLMRLRTARIAAVAVALLALMQIGRMITGEKAAVPSLLRYGAEKEYAMLPGQALYDLGENLRATRKSEKRSHKGAAVAKLTSSVGPTSSRDAVAAAPPPAQIQDEGQTFAETEPSTVPGSNIAAARAGAAKPAETPAPELANRKLIRNATVELEIASFDDVVQRITTFAGEERGYVATTSSQKQANGKLKGEIVVKVLPENLNRFLQKIRDLGELKNQRLGTEDVTKAYFDTDARLKNAHVMEQRLIDMLKTKTGKVSDLLQVEKELGRVREEIEKMRGELKFWDSQVQFATVTISLAEKDLEEPAAFLLKERAQLALYTPDVEKICNDIKGLASQKVQITNAQLNRDDSGRVSAQISILIAPEESDAVIGRVKGLGRVENFQTQIERIAQSGKGMSENAKTKRDKVELNISLSRDEQEQAFQQTSLRIRTSDVDEKARQLRSLAERQNARVRSSSFSRDPDGREVADTLLRVSMKNYPALMGSLSSLGKVENVSVQREDRTGVQFDEATAPADVSIQVYSQGNIVSPETGPIATLRQTLGQGATALMWSLRMISVAVAFLAPWVAAIAVIVWSAKRIARRFKRT